jgi:REP element-mobilizing transposase RayT
MEFIPNNLYHIYNQGNNRQKIFSCNEEYKIFLRLLRQNISAHAEIICWCLMPNHFHLLVATDKRVSIFQRQGGLEIDPLTNGIRKLLSGYARIYNSRHGFSGSLFRQKTKSRCVSDKDSYASKRKYNDSYFNCFNYIHQNPLKAGLVKKIEDWEFSSFKDYAGLRNGTLCNKQLAIDFCSFDPATFIKTSYQTIEEADNFFD